MFSRTPRPHFTRGKDPVPIFQEAGWAPGMVWNDGKSRPHRDSIPDRPARSSVAIPTELPGPRIKYISKLYLKDNDNYMFRLSFLSHLQVVTLGYFNIQLTLRLGTRSPLHASKF